jgi:hypothetical protein
MLPHLQRHCGDAARLRNVLRALLDMIQVSWQYIAFIHRSTDE